MMKYKAVLINSSYMYLLQLLNFMLPLFVLPYLIHTLSIENFGIFVFAQSFVQILIILVDFGFNLSISAKIAELPTGSTQIPVVYWNVIAIKFMFLLGAVLLSLLVLAIYPGWAMYKTTIYYALTTLIGAVFFPVWLYQGLNQLREMTLVSGLAKLLTLPLIFVFVKGPDDYISATLLYGASPIVAGLMSLVHLLSQKVYRPSSFSIISARSIRYYVFESWPFFLSNLSISLYTSCLTLVLSIFGSPAQVGVFGGIERLVRMICFAIYTPVNQAVYPILSRLKHENFREAVALFRKVFYVVLGTMISVWLLVVVAGDRLIQLVLKDSFDALLVRMAALAIIPIALGAVCGQLGLVALGDRGHKTIFTRIYIYIGLISVPVCLLLIRGFYVEGAVFSMLFTELAVCIAMFVAAKKSRFL